MLDGRISAIAPKRQFGVSKIVFVCLASLGLTACGGGGGGGGGGAGPVTYDYSQGTPSTLNNATSNLLLSADSNLPYTSPNGRSFSSLKDAHSTLNGERYPIATRDTNASVAWADGWTGAGVKVGVADGYNSNKKVDAHGDWVDLVINSVAPESSLLQLNVLGDDRTGYPVDEWRTFESNGYHIVNNSWTIDRVLRDDDGPVGLVPESEWNRWVNEDVQGVLNSANKPFDSNMLIVFSAGNTGQDCLEGRIEDCNLFAAIHDGVRKAGREANNGMIYVGSIDDSGAALTDYSLKAGNLKNDFIVAHDDILAQGDAAGTSFAAPRVSGAAALLRQKFPNLDGKGLKQVLLQTATDMGDPGVDEVYGHGKLNIPNAMSPQGRVTPK